MMRKWMLSLLVWASAVVMFACLPDKKVSAPVIPGAEFVGADQCANCHEAQAHTFSLSPHGKAAIKAGEKSGESCESCHGPGSLHIEKGGDKNFIVRKNMTSCFECHSEKKMEFALQYHHPVPEGKVACSDCHNIHASTPKMRSVGDKNEMCLKCHPQKKGPWVFEHEAVTREGCTSCHTPHGSINTKLLIERDYNLCLKCHYSGTQYQSIGHYPHKRALNPSSLGAQYANCTGCHRGIHGSNFSKELRAE